MPRRFVRESKFRHVFGEAYKRINCYDNIDISKNTWDGGSYCAVNAKFIAIVLERCSFIVLPIEKTGRIEPDVPKVNGHIGKILDVQFNPFNTNIIASAGEDSRIKIWNIPENGLTTDLNESVIDLVGHSKKVGIIKWHPSANNILASGGFDNELIIWDVEKGSPVHVLSLHDDIINCLNWNPNGSLIATTSKDRYTRIIDPRKQIVVHKFKAHEGGKPSHVHFIDESRLVTVGCKINAEREISLWNLSDLTTPITNHDLDSGSGNVLVMYDDLLSMLYVAVKGDCNIRYFEISKESPYVHYLSQYTSTVPQRGFGLLPKCSVDVNKCEIFRLYKLSSNGLCEPISMVVPRKSVGFQSDIYPDVPGDIPALTAEQWLTGDDADPTTISLKDGFIPTEKEFTVSVQQKEDDIFDVNMQTAPKREEDLRKAFYQQQDDLHKLKELLKNKELRIRQLEYENLQLKKATGNDSKEDDLKKDGLKVDNLSNGLIDESTSKHITVQTEPSEEFTKHISIKTTTEDYLISNDEARREESQSNLQGEDLKNDSESNDNEDESTEDEEAGENNQKIPDIVINEHMDELVDNIKQPEIVEVA